LCTYDKYDLLHNAIDAGSIHYEGKWEGSVPWKLVLFWALWNGIEPISECHLGPKKVFPLSWRVHHNFSGEFFSLGDKVDYEFGLCLSISAEAVKLLFRP
jgi:hypothetical protein